MGVPAPDVPQPDAYSVLLNVTRRLYDRGIAMQGSPALHALISTTRVLAHPYDLDRLGLTTGDVARLSSERGSFELPVEASDAVPRGSVELAFGTLSDAGENIVGTLISATSLVSEVRLESR
jgi:anaerobic selenocysteine-containing dehydrogenase